MNEKPALKRIVILGGGFGGVYAAMHLERLLPRKGDDVELSLVSRDNFFLFTPMLHEIAASDLEITNIVNPLRKLLRRTKVIVGDVEQIDLPNRRVLISHGYRNHSHALPYDHLILALGSITNIFDLPGLAELALTMKTLPDAIKLRAQIIAHLEEANSECVVTDRQSLLTFVVAGGGFAGVETVAALNDFVREALQYYPNLHEEMLRVVLVHSGAVILPELGESLGRYAQYALTRRGVELRLNTRVTSMTEKEIFLTSSIPMPASTLVWTAGTVPNPLVSSLPCEKENDRVLVNESLQVPGWLGVWAVGDCGFVPDRRQPGKSHPPTAQHAMREGRVVAENIAASLKGLPLKTFSFKTIGLLASIGRRRGVARIFAFNFSGFFAWWLWRTIYLSKLPGLDKKSALPSTGLWIFYSAKTFARFTSTGAEAIVTARNTARLGLAGTTMASRQPANSSAQKKKAMGNILLPRAVWISAQGEPYEGSRSMNANAGHPNAKLINYENARYATHSNSYQSPAARQGTRNRGSPGGEFQRKYQEARPREVLRFRRNCSAVRPPGSPGDSFE